jgi:hypothetical protein
MSMASRIAYPDFTAPDAKTRNLAERMKRFDLHDRLELLRNSFEGIVFRTRFTLADQVILHGLVSSHSRVKVLKDSENMARDAELKSLVGISREVYGLAFDEQVADEAQLLIDSRIRVGRKTSFAGRDALTGLTAINPVADWSDEALVQYVLDHEVPVHPADMPGSAARVA